MLWFVTVILVLFIAQIIVGYQQEERLEHEKVERRVADRLLRGAQIELKALREQVAVQSEELLQLRAAATLSVYRTNGLQVSAERLAQLDADLAEARRQGPEGTIYDHQGRRMPAPDGNMYVIVEDPDGARTVPSGLWLAQECRRPNRSARGLDPADAMETLQNRITREGQEPYETVVDDGRVEIESRISNGPRDIVMNRERGPVLEGTQIPVPTAVLRVHSLTVVDDVIRLDESVVATEAEREEARRWWENLIAGRLSPTRDQHGNRVTTGVTVQLPTQRQYGTCSVHREFTCEICICRNCSHTHAKHASRGCFEEGCTCTESQANVERMPQGFAASCPSTYDFDGEEPRFANCQLATGHAGPHQSGTRTWPNPEAPVVRSRAIDEATRALIAGTAEVTQSGIPVAPIAHPIEGVSRMVTLPITSGRTSYDGPPTALPRRGVFRAGVPDLTPAGHLSGEQLNAMADIAIRQSVLLPEVNVTCMGCGAAEGTEHTPECPSRPDRFCIVVEPLDGVRVCRACGAEDGQLHAKDCATQIVCVYCNVRGGDHHESCETRCGDCGYHETECECHAEAQP